MKFGELLESFRYIISVCSITINLLKDVVTHSSIIWHFAGLIGFDSSSIEHRCWEGQQMHGAPSTVLRSIGFCSIISIGMDFFTISLYVHLPLYRAFSRVIRDCFSRFPTRREPSRLSRENDLHNSV